MRIMDVNLEKEAVLTLTASAAAQVKSLLTKEATTAGKALRVFVEDGGCSGMKYGLVFDEHRDGDVVVEQHGVQVLVDRVSAEYLHGTQIDFKDDLNDSGFKLTNPNARQSCGCGKSFGV